MRQHAAGDLRHLRKDLTDVQHARPPEQLVSYGPRAASPLDRSSSWRTSSSLAGRGACPLCHGISRIPDSIVASEAQVVPRGLSCVRIPMPRPDEPAPVSVTPRFSGSPPRTAWRAACPPCVMVFGLAWLQLPHLLAVLAAVARLRAQQAEPAAPPPPTVSIVTLRPKPCPCLERVGGDARRLRQRADPAAGVRLSDRRDYRKARSSGRARCSSRSIARPFEAVARAGARAARRGAGRARAHRARRAARHAARRERAIPQSQLDNDIQANLAGRRRRSSRRRRRSTPRS